MLGLFAPVFYDYSPFDENEGYTDKMLQNNGRPPGNSAVDCLGLLLAWGLTDGSVMVLRILFGMTMSPVFKYLHFASRIANKVVEVWQLKAHGCDIREIMGYTVV